VQWIIIIIIIIIIITLFNKMAFNLYCPV